MYNDGNIVKVADFGLSRHIENSKMKLTKGNGTPMFWAPELYKEGYAQYKSDVYSLGLILYYMMTNTGPSEKEVATEEFKFPKEYSKEITEMCS